MISKGLQRFVFFVFFCSFYIKLFHCFHFFILKLHCNVFVRKSVSLIIKKVGSLLNLITCTYHILLKESKEPTRAYTTWHLTSPFKTLIESKWEFENRTRPVFGFFPLSCFVLELNWEETFPSKICEATWRKLTIIELLSLSASCEFVFFFERLM